MPLDHLVATIWEEPYKSFRAYMISEGRKGLEPEDVGAVIVKALEVARPRTRYAVLNGKFLNATLPSLLPARWVDRMIGRQLGLLRP
ncbi:MAG TPA: hypothetical protein VGL12_02555 [Roseiarcus sp.]|jgi:hypothetical protein